MRLENFIVAFLVLVLFLTLANIDPYSTGHFMMPSPISLEASLFLIVVFLVLLIFIFLRRKGYTPIIGKIKEKYNI